MSDVDKLRVRIQAAEDRARAAGFLVSSADSLMSDARSLVMRSSSPAEMTEAGISVLGAAKQAQRAEGILFRAQRDVSDLRVKLTIAERIAGQRPAPVQASPAEGTGDETAA